MIGSIFINNKVYFNKDMYIPFLKIIYLFLERREEREQERDKHQCVVASPAPPTGNSVQPRNVP